MSERIIPESPGGIVIDLHDMFYSSLCIGRISGKETMLLLVANCDSRTKNMEYYPWNSNMAASGFEHVSSGDAYS